MLGRSGTNSAECVVFVRETMSIEELVNAVAPPKYLKDGMDKSILDQNQRELGTAFPDDIIEVGETYGTGRFSCGIAVLNPYSPRYLTNVLETMGIYRELRKCEGKDFVAYEVHPVSPGLLIWGELAEGHGLCWLTEGDRNQWPIIVRTIDGVHERFEMTATSFLAKTFRGELECVAWSKEWIEERCRNVTFKQ